MLDETEELDGLQAKTITASQGVYLPFIWLPKSWSGKLVRIVVVGNAEPDLFPSENDEVMT